MCDHPSKNAYCIVQQHIRDGRDDEREDKAAGLPLAELNGWQPPCSRDPIAFSPRGFTITHNDPLEFRQLPPVREDIPPYSVCPSPYRWMREENFRIICEDGKLDIRESDQKDKESGWVFEPDRQIELLKNFWGKLEKNKSLIFLYCNHGNPLDESLNRILLGVSRISQIGPPVIVNYSIGTKRYQKEPDKSDLALCERIASFPVPSALPTHKLPDMQMTRVGRIQTIALSHVHHFFFPRTAQILGAFWQRANSITNHRVRLMLLFWLESQFVNLSLRNRYRPGVSFPYNPLTGVFYVPAMVSEASVFTALKNKLKRIATAFQGYSPVSERSRIETRAASGITIPDSCVDYIFTDPPFGENIYYSDLNFFVEAWLRVFTNSAPEAIVDRVKGKELVDYQRMMQDCFQNFYRVLKPGRWMTVEFHNSKNSVWNAIQEALQRVGFVIADVRTLDKQQGSFQQVVSGNTVKRDLIISAYKPNGGLEEQFKKQAGTPEGAWQFVRTHLKQLPIFVAKSGRSEVLAERQAYLLFDRMVAFHVQRGYPVPLSTSEFYAGLHQRLIERDGMYFLPDQVNEYDRNKLEVNGVEQYELFVSDEKSAIQWVRRQLSQEPMTYKELQPVYMKEAQRVWDKHEQPVELRIILEQNFVQDNDGTWRLPDPRQESDLEQIRNRALMKEFQQYLDAKGKLKVVRAEALRAGFKDAWQRRDYTTIVQMTKRVPETVVQEDQALLMYFDNASLLLGG
jgi:hypothetical protein